MDDIGSALSNILSNPQTMQQIMSLASQLGLGEGTPPASDPPALQPAYAPANPPPPPSPPETGAFIPAMGAGPQAGNGAPGAAQALPGGLDIAALSRVAQMMGSLNTRDQNVELLLALKPHFGEKRRKKVDDAIRIMQLIRLLPALKETGIFGSLLGGGD